MINCPVTKNIQKKQYRLPTIALLLVFRRIAGKTVQNAHLSMLKDSYTGVGSPQVNSHCNSLGHCAIELYSAIVPLS